MDGANVAPYPEDRSMQRGEFTDAQRTCWGGFRKMTSGGARKKGRKGETRGERERERERECVVE